MLPPHAYPPLPRSQQVCHQRGVLPAHQQVQRGASRAVLNVGVGGLDGG